MREELLTRRAVMGMLGGVGAALAAGCVASTSPSATSAAASSSSSSGTGGGGASSSSSAASTGSGAACDVTPDETAGPYPDKTGMLGDPTYFRRDITEGMPGLPLALTLVVTDETQACAPIPGAIVEIWQCNATGEYSEYSQPGYDGTGETFLRGLQTADANGKVTFNTIYPGWYSGRATHIHFEVYVNGQSVKTSQVAFPEEITTSVYGTGVYAAHGQNTMTNASDMVFGDGDEEELVALTGDTTNGYAGTLQVGVG